MPKRLPNVQMWRKLAIVGTGPYAPAPDNYHARKSTDFWYSNALILSTEQLTGANQVLDFLAHNPDTGSVFTSSLGGFSDVLATTMFKRNMFGVLWSTL